MKTLAPEFSAHRMVSDYVRDFYAPGARAYEARNADAGEMARDIELWREKVAGLLEGVRFERVTARDEDGLHLFEAAIYPNGLGEEFRSGSLMVEVYCEPEAELDGPCRGRLELNDEADGRLIFSGGVRSTRPLEHFTSRVVPVHPMAFGRLEMPPPVWAESPRETG